VDVAPVETEFDIAAGLARADFAGLLPGRDVPVNARYMSASFRPIGCGGGLDAGADDPAVESFVPVSAE
jgi:hypothetical protein